MALVPFEAGVAIVGVAQAALGAYLHLRDQPGGDIVMAGAADAVQHVGQQVRGQLDRFREFRNRPGPMLRREGPRPPIETVFTPGKRNRQPSVFGISGGLFGVAPSTFSFKREIYRRRRRTRGRRLRR